MLFDLLPAPVKVIVASVVAGAKLADVIFGNDDDD